MANNYSFLCLLGAIDRLWFHHTILFSEPMSLFGPKSTIEDQTPQDSIITDSFTYPSSSVSFTPLADEEIDFSPLLYEENSSDSPQTATPQDDSNNEEEDETNSTDSINPKNKKKIRPTRLNLLANRMLKRSHSSDQQKRPQKNRTLSSASATSSPGYAAAEAAARKLQKSMSCRSLGELELEEVKGFMDLGFTFKREHLSPRMMSLVPGLQRLGMSNNKKLQNGEDDDDSVEVAADKDEDGEGEVEVTRPYLSEAWLIKRPDSPLLNLRLPRVSAAADMKKHLKFWARTVASEIHQES
ncbi:PREDICTED: uncharacterized protein LOC103337975 [Prunus mume]|uniref:Uncharacterized protein LOC103337975 n=1 Tax=Prunus mume TaxID=102107 RepID=A0ABM0PGP4_PRUMU|nr:PREDICTED: uncharacterized protein LOC103337975 [Prunus mume]